MTYKRVKSTLKSILNVTGSQCKDPEDWCDMLRFSGSSQNPGSSVLDELQLSNGLLGRPVRRPLQ